MQTITQSPFAPDLPEKGVFINIDAFRAKRLEKLKQLTGKTNRRLIEIALDLLQEKAELDGVA